MSEEEAEEVVLSLVQERGRLSPRKLEAAARGVIGARQARAALQRLLNRGVLRIDDTLRVVVGEA